MATVSGIFNSGSIKKFDGEEFQVWKWRMEAILKIEDLWDVVAGEEKPPCGAGASGGAEQEVSEVVDTNVDNSAPPMSVAPMSVEEASALARREAKAYYTILQGLEGTPARQVRTAKTAKEVWDRLLAVYESRSLWNMGYLRRKLFGSFMAEGEPVFEYIDRIRLITQELEAIGSPVSEKEKVELCLRGLSNSFQYLVMHLRAMGNEHTFEYVTKEIIDEELRQTVWATFSDEDDKEDGNEGKWYSTQRKGAHARRNRPMNAKNREILF